MINIFLLRLLQPQPALSLIELLVALPILAFLSTAGLEMFQSTQTSFVDGRTSTRCSISRPLEGTDVVDPASFHTSFIENVSASTAGLNIDAPDRIKMRGKLRGAG
jgi:hypothetical protein